MDRARHKSSLSSERFIGSFLPSAAAGDQTASAAFELDEDDLFAAGSGSPEPPQPARRPLILSSIRTGNPRPLPRLRRPPEGILDALPERRRSPPLSSSSASSSSTSSPAAAPPRMIPAVPRPAPAPHMPQSAPVNVPAARLRKPPVVAMMDEAEDEDDEEMLPPHEMVARARARESPMTTFSMLEGAGRTLKGRDLRQLYRHWMPDGGQTQKSRAGGAVQTPLGPCTLHRRLPALKHLYGFKAGYSGSTARLG